MLGYDTFEDDRTFIQDGITGEVRRYTTANMQFPCFVILNNDAKPVKSHSIDTLQRMFPVSKVYTGDDMSEIINIYFNQDDKTVRLGSINQTQVKTFLRLFENNDIDGYIDENTKLNGMYLYVLSN